MKFDIKSFVKERDEVLLSLDKNKIKDYMKKYKVRFEPKDEKLFWAGVHKAILYIDSATKEQKSKSKDWLLKNGFRLYFM